VLAGLYVALMSVSGSVIVYRNELTPRFSVEWFVNLHASLLAGNTGRFVNGIGALCLTSLCLTGAVIWCRDQKLAPQPARELGFAHSRLSWICTAPSGSGPFSLF